MNAKSVLGVLLGLAVLALLGVFQPWKRGAGKLRNPVGVGPAHVPGVPRGEEQVRRNGSHEISSVAGRIAGSIDPR